MRFYAYERYIVKGSTINKKRIYSEVDCELRTKDSFTNKKQLEHHTGKMDSPLILIPNFDPVHQVFLDSMHLFHLGVMKTIFGKFIDTSSKYKLGTQQKNELADILKNVSAGIIMEFQRKELDLKNYSYWKATHHIIILLYCLPFIFKKFISTNKYKHLLLLYTAVRILYNNENAVKYAKYARAYLRQFFILMNIFLY